MNILRTYTERQNDRDLLLLSSSRIEAVAFSFLAAIVVKCQGWGPLFVATTTYLQLVCSIFWPIHPGMCTL